MANWKAQAHLDYETAVQRELINCNRQTVKCLVDQRKWCDGGELGGSACSV